MFSRTSIVWVLIPFGFIFLGIHFGENSMLHAARMSGEASLGAFAGQLVMSLGGACLSGLIAAALAFYDKKTVCWWFMVAACFALGVFVGTVSP